MSTPPTTNNKIIELGAFFGRLLRNNSDLGVVCGINITRRGAIRIQLSNTMADPAGALLSWFKLLDGPRVYMHRSDPMFTTVLVQGDLDKLRVTVDAAFAEQDAANILIEDCDFLVTDGDPTEGTLRRLQDAGAQ